MTNYYFALDCKKTNPVIKSMSYAVHRKTTDWLPDELNGFYDILLNLLHLQGQ